MSTYHDILVKRVKRVGSGYPAYRYVVFGFHVSTPLTNYVEFGLAGQSGQPELNPSTHFANLSLEPLIHCGPCCFCLFYFFFINKYLDFIY
jgi:hypothetical protein